MHEFWAALPVAMVAIVLCTAAGVTAGWAAAEWDRRLKFKSWLPHLVIYVALIAFAIALTGGLYWYDDLTSPR